MPPRHIAPDPDSIVWWPARAALGDGEALLLLLAGGLVAARRRDGDLLAAVCRHRRQRLGERGAGPSRTRAPTPFRAGSRQQALRWKEFVLLRRDPWLVSQTLMQLLYLVPPALMLWRSFADSSAAIVLITPVIVMAAGQLAGGLAWLTISGEDAADLVATAPLPPSRVIRAKIEVVLIAIGVMFAPLVVALAFASPLQAAVTALGVVIAAASATAIQLWFRVQARRSQFRRRQTSSRLATFAEAFSSIGWAATAALALAMPFAAAHQRPDDRRHPRRDLEDQPAARVDSNGREPLCLDQFHHRRRKGLRLFLRKIMAGTRDDTMDAAAGEFRRHLRCRRSQA